MQLTQKVMNSNESIWNAENVIAYRLYLHRPITKRREYKETAVPIMLQLEE